MKIRALMGAFALMVATTSMVGVPAHPAFAAFPQTAPNDPDYASQTYLFDHIPSGYPLATDPENASGMSVDRAWANYTAGSSDTVIAYVEGGINWHDTTASDLVNQVYINRGELPVPCASAPCTTKYSKQASAYDINHDGRFNIQDYATDPRVSDHNGNGYEDPEDLIAVFSDGTDHDHNGYVDDISGYDFYDKQNDPATIDAAYTHANNQMRQAAAQANNNFMGAGVCPNCMILPIKAGAEALDRTDDLAQAWLFAADSGADVIVSVTADFGYSSFMKQAVDSIWKRGIVMVEASNDFDSTDHQGGMFWPHVLPGNGLVANTQGVPDGQALTTTFRARSNYTSWGTHNMFSVATTGGTTSTSTPTVGGVAALLLAEGKQAAAQHEISSPLTAAEVVQVMRSTASDIADPTLPWAGKQGWDLQYGYGRPNVYLGMKAIAEGRIPPVTWFDSPDWYSIYDPTTTSTVPVTGYVAAPRSSSYTWKLQFAPGAEPTNAQFVNAATGSGTAPFEGSLGSIDLSKVPQSFWNAAFKVSSTKSLETNEQYTVTLRIQVTDASGRVGEERRAIAVHHDPALMPGFAKRTTASGEGQPALVDLQGTGHLDIVYGDADGFVHALDPATGNELKGWPVHTDRTVVVKKHAGIKPGYQPIVNDVAVGDLNHDGRLEVVASSTTGFVYVFNAKGRRVPGWPIAVDTGVQAPPIPRPAMPFTRLPARGAVASPVLADINGDHTLEIVQAGWDGYIHIWKADGANLTGWPVKVTAGPLGAAPAGYTRVNDQKLDSLPVVADIDGDGHPEIVVRSQYTDVTGSGITFAAFGHLYAFHRGGARVQGWPNTFSTIAEYYGSAQEFVTEGSASPVAADVTGTGRAAIAAGGAFGPTYLFDGTGVPITTYGDATDLAVTLTTSGAFGNFGGTGLAYAQPGSAGTSVIDALLTPGSGQPINNVERAYTAAGGVPLPGFPAKLQGLDFLGAPIFTDVTGDGSSEIVNAGDSSALHGFASGGGQAAGFPKFFSGWSLWSPSAGDLLSNGHTDLVMLSREGYVFAWSTNGVSSGNDQWWHADHDERNTGTYGVDTRPPGVIANLAWAKHAPTASFTAPGDDWYTGTVASYRVTFAPSNTTVTVAPTGAAGTTQTVTVPSGTTHVTVQAIDDAGNLGPPRTK